MGGLQLLLTLRLRRAGEREGERESDPGERLLLTLRLRLVSK